MSGVVRALVTHRRLLPVVAAGLATLLLLSYHALSSSPQPPVPEAPLRLTMNTPQWLSSPTDGMRRFKRAAAQEFTPQPQVRTFVPIGQVTLVATCSLASPCPLCRSSRLGPSSEGDTYACTLCDAPCACHRHACVSNPLQLGTLPVGNKQRDPTVSRSQHAEDIYAYEHFFYGRGGGTFLEMGALNGLQWSNTVALERVLGWRGVLIEASPSSYKQLAVNRDNQVRVVFGQATYHTARPNFKDPTRNR